MAKVDRQGISSRGYPQNGTEGEIGEIIPVDCGLYQTSLPKPSFFGYRKVHLLGATENRQGLLEAAHGGIIFLDEISNLPFRLQAKLCVFAGAGSAAPR